MADKDTQYGLNMLINVGVYWERTGSATEYSDDNKLLNIDNIVSELTLNSSSVGSIKVVLDDTDDTIKTFLNSNDPHKVRCYVNLFIAPSFITLFTGFISGSSISWSEGGRTISFTAETAIEARDVGYALEPNDTMNDDEANPINFNEDAFGVAWPLVFGHVKRVPTVKIAEPISSESTTDTYLSDDDIIIKLSDDKNFSGDELWYKIANCKFQASLVSGQLEVVNDTMNSTWYTDLSIDTRVADDDENNRRVLWLVDDTADLLNKFCFTGTYYSKCYRQEGVKCWFTMPMFSVGDSQPTSITEVRGFPDSSWNDDDTFAVNYTILAGNLVTLAAGTEYSLYVFNLSTTQSGNVKEVMAYRTINNVDKLVAVPSSYYTKHLLDMPSRYTTANPDANTQCSVLRFDKPLEDRDGENWKSDVLYVSQNSDEDSDTAEVLDTLIEYYSDLSSNATSKSDLSTNLTRYPSHFALTKRGNILKIIEDIAWQARVGIKYIGSILFYIYLSKTPSPSVTIDEDSTLLKTLSISSTPSSSIITKITGKWSDNLADEPNLYIQSNNVNLHGLIEAVYDIYIYNLEDLAQYTIDYWLQRYSESFKIVSIDSAMPLLEEDVLDFVNINYTNDFVTNTICKGLIEKKTLDVSTYKLNFQILTESIVGTTSASGSLWKDVLGGSADDPTVNLSEIDYIVPLETEPENSSRIINVGGGEPNIAGYVYRGIITNRNDVNREVTVNLYGVDGVEIVSGQYSGITVKIDVDDPAYNLFFTKPLFPIGSDINITKNNNIYYWVGVGIVEPHGVLAYRAIITDTDVDTVTVNLIDRDGNVDDYISDPGYQLIVNFDFAGTITTLAEGSPEFNIDDYIWVTYHDSVWSWLGVVHIKGGVEIHVVFPVANADSGDISNISCYVDTDGVGNPVDVNVEIIGGGSLEDAIPILADGTRFYAEKVGSNYYSTTIFHGSDECVCEDPP